MRTAFRIVAGVFGVVVIGLSLPFAITSFTDDAESIHRLHFLAGVFASGLLLGGSLLVCARRPESTIGPFWVAVATGVASTIAGLISGDFISGLWFIAPISLVILIALHPERSSLLRIDGIEVATAFLGLVALVPAVAYALTQAELQRNGFVSDPHVEFHHYSGMASYALSLPLAAFAAALLVPGRRIAVWIVGVTGAGLGLASLLLSDYPGAFRPAWAWLTLAWGVALVAVAAPSGGRVTVERRKPKTLWRKIERWMVGVVMAAIAFVIERMVLRSIRRAGKPAASKEELHTTLTSKGGEVDLTDGH